MFPNTNNNALIKSLTKYSLVNAIFAQPPIIRPDLDESIVDLCHSVSTQVFPARRAAVAVIKRYFNFSTIIKQSIAPGSEYSIPVLCERCTLKIRPSSAGYTWSETSLSWIQVCLRANVAAWCSKCVYSTPKVPHLHSYASHPYAATSWDTRRKAEAGQCFLNIHARAPHCTLSDTSVVAR